MSAVTQTNEQAPTRLRTKEELAASFRPQHRVPTWTIVRHAVLIGFCSLVIFPVLWVLLLSIKSLPDAYQNYIWPNTFDFSHYAYAWNSIPTLRGNYWNSIFVTTMTVIITTVCATLAGFALVFLRIPGKGVITALFIASLFFPTRVTAFIGIFQMQNELGLINRAWGLIFPYTALGIAISVFVMRGVFQTVPKDLVDASRIDGAGPLRLLVGIMLPIVRNGIVVVIIINFVTAWGEYLLASRLMNEQGQWTLPVVLASASGGMGAWAWPRLAAVYIMAITPGLIFFAIAQRWYMKGLQEGALKA
ncbi:carbohydrate ABC transporter permease [soil metagenome]|jgi:ABC-type glycerol-3-phosphate transport system permease component